MFGLLCETIHIFDRCNIVSIVAYTRAKYYNLMEKNPNFFWWLAVLGSLLLDARPCTK
jgi:hypothetical protein